MIRRWIAAFVVVGAYLAAGWSLESGSGLVRAVVANTAAEGQIESRRVDAVDLQGIDQVLAAHGDGPITVRWQGAWELPASGLYELALSSGGRSTWTIDGVPALVAESADSRAATRTVWLDAGAHPVDIATVVDGHSPRIAVGAGRNGQPPVPLTNLRTRAPTFPRLRAWGRTLHSFLGWCALLALVWSVRGTISLRREAWRRWCDAAVPARWRAIAPRAAAWTALAVILLYGTALRLDSITGRYGVVTSPSWLAALQTRTIAPPAAIRPASMRWDLEPLYSHRDGPPTHYLSDPYIYLDAARHMSSFYVAHFREPVFPFATRMFLHVLDGQDVAVSFASVFFSVLAIWLTYILGAAAWSRPVGVLAALALALDHDVISLSSIGWRDDAYMAAIALCAYALLRCWRSLTRPAVVWPIGRLRIDVAYVEAAAFGVAAGLAVLTRIMAVPFLAAAGLGLLFAWRSSWRRRLATLGIVTIVTIVVAGPYFFNCWRVYGDPLYTFNVHGNIYSAAEGTAANTTTADYIRHKIASSPIDTLDTVAQGLTTYPFTNKWHGLDTWQSGLGEWASAAAIAGMLVLAATSFGRLLLAAMVCSLIPFSLTWKVDPNFRFTEYVYPALLIASAVTVDVVLRGARAVLAPKGSGVAADRRTSSWPAWAATVAAGAAALWFVARVSPSWMLRETLRAQGTAMVTAGVRDGGFFDHGWSDVVTGDGVGVRVARDEGSVSLLLPATSDYSVSLRMDPFPRPLAATVTRLPTVDISFNGTSLSTIALHWTDDRVGAYDIVLPRPLVRAGVNRLGFHVRRPPEPEPRRPGLTDGDAISLWYVRVRPGAR